jgi:hypothetical protein
MNLSVTTGRMGALTGDATEPAWNSYLLTVACPCGVVFERWITPEEPSWIYCERTSLNRYWSLRAACVELGNSPVEWAQASVTTALPAPHIWVGEARAVATGEVRRLHLNCAEHWCVDELGDPPFVIADALSRHLADCTNTEGWIIAALNGDLRPLSREPFRDKTSEHLAGTTFLASKDGFQLPHLPRVRAIINIDTDGSIATEEVLRKIDEPYDCAAAEIHSVRLSLLDGECQCARAPSSIGFRCAQTAGARGLAAAHLDQLSRQVPSHSYCLLQRRWDHLAIRLN